jgi:hypothetical protein
VFCRSRSGCLHRSSRGFRGFYSSWLIVEARKRTTSARCRLVRGDVLGRFSSKRADPAKLGNDGCSSTVFAYGRFFSVLGGPSQAGIVPDLGSSGCTWRLLNAVEKQGLD